jgi:hypothetical protein
MHKPRVEDDTSYWGKKWRSMTSLPWNLFETVVKEAQPLRKPNQRGKAHPLKLMVALGLIHLRSGATMAFVATLGGVDCEVLRRFVKRWLRYTAVHVVPQHVYVPRGEELERVLNLHARLGFPGCLPVWDGVECDVIAIPAALTPAHTNKDNGTSRGFLVAGDATRRIMYTSPSFEGGTNDKTKARYPGLMQDLRDGLVHPQATFELYTSEDTKETFSGLWGLSDAGFHPWATNYFPVKICTGALRSWSQRAESFRKPGTENIYGIIKRRYRIFGVPWSFQGVRYAHFGKSVQVMDDAWLMACALHNRLMVYDGIHDLGRYESDFCSVNVMVDLNRAIHKPSEPLLPSNTGALYEDTPPEEDPAHKPFLDKLVAHLQFQWAKREVRWLRTARSSRGSPRDLAPRQYGRRKHPHLAASDDADSDVDEDQDVFDEDEPVDDAPDMGWDSEAD